MPVEEDVTIDLGTSDKTFDELDRAAAKAIKTLEKRDRELKKSLSTASKAEREEKRLSNRGGIFGVADKPLPSSGAPQDIKAPEKQTFEEKILEKAKKDAEGEREKLIKSLKGRIFDEDSKASTINNILNIGKNPARFAAGLMKLLPHAAVLLLVKQILDEIIKLDKFFKVFIDEIDNRIDKFRTLQEQSDVNSGLAQRIITTASGSTEPRYSYNTFEQFNNNQAEHELKTQMLNISGVE